MRSAVEFVVAFYLFICVMLMVFNLLYMARSSIIARHREARVRAWERVIREDGANFVLDDAQVGKLKRIGNLTGFNAALANLELDQDALNTFFLNNAHQIQELAIAYGGKSAMERAFMAYFIASFHCSSMPNRTMLAEILLSYLDDSTVFCRENVFQALNSLGSSQALEHAFEILNENRWYHSPKLISDGMANFTGDKERLAKRLWNNHGHWQEPLNVATVQFASSLKSNCMDEPFMHALTHEETTLEVRFALLRYFQHHPTDEARSILLKCLEDDNDLAIVAAAALGSYEGADVKEALKHTLRSRNWYVRHNSAQSLVRLGFTEDDRREIEQSGDRYALEMLEYVLARDAQSKAKRGNQA